MKTVKIELMKDSSEVVHYEREGVHLYIREANLSVYPELRAPCHWHDDLECIHILDGVMGYSINGQEIVLHAGDSLIINARQVHFGHDCDKQDCRFLCILFHPSLFTGSDALLKKEVMPVLEHPGLAYWHLNMLDSIGQTAAEILRRIAALKSAAPVGYELEAIGLLHILWGRLTRQIGELPPPPGNPYTDLELQKDMVSYIYQNYGRKLTLAEIASSGRVSRSKCCQMFQRYLQQSPIDYLNDYRLRVSCNLLRSTELSITEIALSCGFNHLSYFSKMFMERFGCMPKEYRRRHCVTEMPEEATSGEYTTDDGGYIYIDDLTVQGKGKLFIRELEAAPGYELDKEYKTVYVQPGKTIEITWENVPITGQFQIHKFAAEYNEVTGTPAGTPLQGAVYEISEARSGKVVDYITTDARGVAASKPLPLGRYKIVEVTAPAYWQVSGKTFDETLEYSGQIIKVSDYDKPSNLGVVITKRGNAEVLAGSQMRYDFTVANTSNVPLDNYYWHDRIPTDAARATVFTTGTYSARLNYRILYKTNYSGTYQVLASNLLTSSSYSFSLNAIPTQAGEYVTDIYLDFGKVPVGFQSTSNPTLTVQVLGTIANGYQIINRADVGGKYQGTWQTGQATWVTIVRKLTPNPSLPKTGY